VASASTSWVSTLVIIDIGRGVFVFNARVVTGSSTVKVGDHASPVR
jgi:hypothetical protein